MSDKVKANFNARSAKFIHDDTVYNSVVTVCSTMAAVYRNKYMLTFAVLTLLFNFLYPGNIIIILLSLI